MAFEPVTSPVLTLIEDRIDTDVLFPARFLLLMEKKGLGRYLFNDRRVDGEDRPIPNPVDDAARQGARILLSGREFGCGSSREQAVWALADFGIRCVIAESFGEIFAANCVRNAVLAIRLGREDIRHLAALAEHGPLTVDLDAMKVGRDEDWLTFDVAPATRERLLNGWDEIDMILARAGDNIARFEERQREIQPWLYEGPSDDRES